MTKALDAGRTALLIMDYQNGIVGRAPDSDALLQRASETITKVRAAGGTIAYVRVGFVEGDFDGVPETSGMAKNAGPHAASSLHAEAASTQIHDAVAPEEGDIVVRKVRVGAFGTTDLHEQLAARGVDTLLIGGISTSGCVHSTITDGYDRDFRQLVVADLCVDRDAELHSILIEKVFPKRAEVITTADLDEML
jgi:nicotinamidase-related amidase